MESDRAKLELVRRVQNGDESFVAHKEPTHPQSPAIPALSVTEKMEFTYNPDGTLNTLIVNTENPVEYRFVWNSDSTLSRIIKRETV